MSDSDNSSDDDGLQLAMPGASGGRNENNPGSWTGAPDKDPCPYCSRQLSIEDHECDQCHHCKRSLEQDMPQMTASDDDGRQLAPCECGEVVRLERWGLYNLIHCGKCSAQVSHPDEHICRRLWNRAMAPREVSAVDLAAATRGLLEAMNMQESRERGEFHLSQPAAIHLWNRAKWDALAALDRAPAP